MPRDNSALKFSFSSAFGFLIGIAFALNTAYFFLDWIYQEAKGTAAGTSTGSQLSGFVAIMLCAVLLEKFLPLRHIAPTDWIYRSHPSHRAKISILHILAQTALMAFVGATIGAAHGKLVLFSSFAAGARLLPLLFKRLDIPHLLKAGRALNISKGAVVLLDSQLLSFALTEVHLRWRRHEPSSHYGKLIARRILRQPHLLLTMFATMTFSYSLMEVLPELATAFFLFTWAVLGASMARCADFSQLSGSELPKHLTLATHTCLGCAFIIAAARPLHIMIFIALAAPSVYWCGLIRSKNREVSQVSMMETGAIGSVSPRRFFSFSCLALSPWH